MTDPTPYYKQNRLKQLRALSALAREGSISAAAESLSLSQPAVSLQLQALEREFGASLFDRRGRTLTLSPHGKLLVELSDPLVHTIDNLVSTFLARIGDVEEGGLRIAAEPSTALYLLPRVIERFRATHPGLDLQMQSLEITPALDKLRAGEIDLIVSSLDHDCTDLTVESLLEVAPVLITSPDHPLQQCTNFRLRDILRYRLICPPRHLPTWQVIDALLSGQGIEPEVALQVESGGWEVVKRYVEADLGIAFVSGICLTGRERVGSIDIGTLITPRRYGLITRRGARHSPQAMQFIELLRATWSS
ncbi:LysR family transcriptional regulator [Gammaproteobacteria bacterium]|nr:LysR family transcriptional regulator [Gammaproteobacteria bacterium]